MRVLIAEDETELARGLKYLLEKESFMVELAYDGEEAIDYIDVEAFDVIVLDIMMPKKTGLDVLKYLRDKGLATPAMMLTAKAEIEDRVLGLESGADDYLPKPFSTKEFIARVKALSRRNAGYTSTNITLGNTTLDGNAYEITYKDKKVRLNNKEYKVAELLFQNPRHVFSTEQLMDLIWGMESDAEINVVWTTIGFVRKKLKDLGADAEIKTVRGAGYSLEVKA